MEIKNAKDAEEFIRAWLPHGERGRWHMAKSAESQRFCARVAGEQRRPREQAGHLAAAEALEKAAHG